jgi:hypothetical protein
MRSGDQSVAGIRNHHRSTAADLRRVPHRFDRLFTNGYGVNRAFIRCYPLPVSPCPQAARHAVWAALSAQPKPDRQSGTNAFIGLPL